MTSRPFTIALNTAMYSTARNATYAVSIAMNGAITSAPNELELATDSAYQATK